MTQEHLTVKYDFKITGNPLSFGLALASGTGLTLMIVALGAGVLFPETPNALLNLGLFAGLALLVLGIIGWAAMTQPFRHFDDIDQPLDDGHGHGHAPASTAIVPAEGHAAPEQHAAHH
jgi:hypothetical protein